jgi:D-sedoheptulose 7-phosphate isomerase
MEEAILRALDESIQAKEGLKAQAPAIARAASMLIESLTRGNKVLICGNGGSAADAQHIAAELVGRFEQERPGLPVMALTTNTSNLTALANDYDYSGVFRRQVEAFVRQGDVVIGISTSGNSANVVEALRAAGERGARTIAMTGAQAGKAGEVSELTLTVPSTRTCRIQECHITMGHIICEHVERALMKTSVSH